jgi:protein ImuB
MLPRPLLLEAVSVVPDGPPVRFRHGSQTHEVAKAHGPERIETAWWRGPTVRRDYYVVETKTGARYWLFRRLRGGGWFLHGMFG